MDFKELKKKAQEATEKAKKFAEEQIDTAGEKLASSKFVIQEQKKLDAFVKKNKDSVLLFWEKKSDFYQKALYQMPILATKSWVSAVKFSLVDASITMKQVTEFPSLVVLKSGKVKKVITGEEKILKIIASLDVDIRKAIENMK